MPPKKPAKSAKPTKPKKSKKPAKPNRERGRPSAYREEFPGLAKRYCLLGATDADLAEFFDVCVDTINEWKTKHVEFSVSVKEGKRIADMRIAEKLFNRAEGAVINQQQAIKVKHTEYDPETGKKVREFEEVEIVDLQQELPPDTTAGIFWLKNRKGDSWNDKHQHQVQNLGKDGKPADPAGGLSEADRQLLAQLNAPPEA